MERTDRKSRNGTKWADHSESNVMGFNLMCNIKKQISRFHLTL